MTTAVSTFQSHDTTPLRSGFRARIKAALVHAVISLVVASAVLALVYFGWYPAPLDRASGVGTILLLLLSVDVVLGPVLTFVVFNRAKKSLPFDLAVIGALQLAALGYGLHTVEAGRPTFVVFVKDRFELVARADLKDDDIADGRANLHAVSYSFSPKTVAALAPESSEERKTIMMESVLGGRDLQHYPKLYVDYASQQKAAAAKGQPLEALRSLNPNQVAEIERAIRAAGRESEALRYLPVKGPEGDVAMLIDASTGEALGLVDAVPWR